MGAPVGQGIMLNSYSNPYTLWLLHRENRAHYLSDCSGYHIGDAY